MEYIYFTNYLEYRVGFELLGRAQGSRAKGRRGAHRLSKNQDDTLRDVGRQVIPPAPFALFRLHRPSNAKLLRLTG